MTTISELVSKLTAEAAIHGDDCPVFIDNKGGDTAISVAVQDGKIGLALHAKEEPRRQLGFRYEDGVLYRLDAGSVFVPDAFIVCVEKHLEDGTLQQLEVIYKALYYAQTGQRP